jgi:replicative DNA helicase
MARKSGRKRKPANRTRKKENIIISIVKFVFKWIFRIIKYLFIWLFYAFRYLFNAVKRHVSKSAIITAKLQRKLSKKPLPEITVIETIKGNYDEFWNHLVKSDSMIGLVIGARGSGKTAMAMTMIEKLAGTKNKIFAMGFSDLPDWIRIVDKVEDLLNDSFVVIDEGGILFSSRDSMSNANKFLSELLFVARHKNLTIIFISQNSSNLEINTLRQADFMILKKSSLLQKNFERKIIAKIYDDYADKFEQYKKIRGLALVYSNDFVGFVENNLPSFWSTKVSKGFR